MTDLGALAGHNSYASGINDSAVVVGESTLTANVTPYHAFLRRPPASYGRPWNTGRRQQYCGSDQRLWERGWQFLCERWLLFRLCVDPSRRNAESRP